MQPQSQIIFDPFRMDLTSECLWLNNQPVQLTPKAFALLRYLVERAGQLVTKEELLNEVWPNTYVSDAVLKVCIGELRKALGDDAKQPRFIKTSHRRGYLFIGNVARDAPPPKVSGAAKISPSFRSSRAGLPAIVGREAELVCLQDWLERARRGERQVIFVTGEPGIGKSSLIETFLERVAGDQEIWIARGQCLEQYGTGEPYLPVLEALSGLCREPGRDRMVALLRQQAPMWLAQSRGWSQAMNATACNRR